MPISKVSVLRLFLNSRLEKEQKETYVADMLWLISKQLGASDSVPMYSDIKNEDTKESRSGEEIKSDILNKLRKE